MTDFVFTDLVKDPPARVESAALGASTSAKMVTADEGKAVTLASSNNYVLAGVGDEIEGFVSSVEPYTVNGGFSFGGVKRDGRMICEVDASQVSTVAVGGLVVAGTQAALGTAGLPTVKGGTPTIFLWRVLRILTGPGAAGDTVLIERV
jgi:hypothetical protein